MNKSILPAWASAVIHQPDSRNESGTSSRSNLRFFNIMAQWLPLESQILPASTSKECEWNESCLDKSLEFTEQRMLEPVTYSGQPVATDKQMKPDTFPFPTAIQQELPPEVIMNQLNYFHLWKIAWQNHQMYMWSFFKVGLILLQSAWAV